MTAHPAGIRVRAAVAALCGIAAIATAAGAALSPAAAAGRPQHRPGPAAASVPVVINCTGHAQTRPHRYILACGDGNAYLTGLHWAAWGPASAFAAGTDTFKVCIPSCAAGPLRSFPVLAALWRAEPRPGHSGQRYFTRLTIIYTGPRSYRAGGKTYHLHQTVTYPLSASGGA
jgi:hypothetical protein